jgi:sulfide dehydrogenase [flavocytochrome c] flavoprotein chain
MLARQYGIKVIHDTAAAIDPVAKTVALEGGAKLAYDRAVVAPGIAFKFGAIEGYDEAATQTIPHACNAGPQTKLSCDSNSRAWRTVAFF